MTPIALLALACTHRVPETAPPAGLAYPPARRTDVVDVIHGVEVPDPYRWLEDPDSPETRAWIEAENALAEQWLSAVPEREALRRRLAELMDHPRWGLPVRRGGRWFYTRNDGLQDQPVLYVADGPDAEPHPLVDPNALSDDGTVALAGFAPSEDGRLLAYGLSDGGSDWRTWQVLDVETGEALPDELHWIKWGAPAWTHDGRGFFYTRYPEPDRPLEQVNEHHAVWWHELGTPQSEDVRVVYFPEHPRWGYDVEVTEDGRWLLVSQGEGTEEVNRLWAFRLDPSVEDGPPLAGEMVRLVDDYTAGWWYLGNEGSRAWFLTNDGAPRKRIATIDLETGERAEVVPELEETIESADLVGDRLVVRVLDDAATRVLLFTRDGEPAGEVALPGTGTAWGFGGRTTDHDTFFAYSDFTTPTSIYRLDLDSGEVSTWRAPELDFDPGAYVTEQVFYESADGTRIPMFLVHRRDVVPDGNRPVLLYGYGGFNISITPWFRPRNLAWLEMGGVYASANIRGGGEYGEEWHRAGTLENKPHVFEDFEAAARWLVENGWTRPERLAIAGASNGGLLVGAVITRHPELFGAALPAVGVLDMLRYHLFTIGWAWASDYGTVDDPEMFRVLLSYSPVHNVREGTCYPATLITTGDHDDRVVPAHSFKFAAALQHAQGCEAPVLVRIETRAGHGAGKSTTMRIEEQADRLAFLVRALGVEAAPAPVTTP